jgi:hypothetical protein
MSGQIFISYRREESRWSARSLRDRLCRDFDPNQIFMDIDAIALGEDFVEAIETTVAKCDVLIAVIGNNWLTSKDDRGNRRLDNPEDFVRMEIGVALKRKIRVIPVLVDNALMPQSTDLPEELKPLVRRNALLIHDTSFDGDCQRLATAIRQVLEKVAAEQREKERLEAEQREKERLETERVEKERLEAERLEKERLAAEQREKERPAAERREKERLEAERLEKERLEAEQREKERLKAEQRQREEAEARQREEKERLEAEQREKEPLEAEQRQKKRLLNPMPISPIILLARGESSSFSSIAIASDLKTLASGSDDNTVRLWRVSDGELLHTLTGPKSQIDEVAFKITGVAFSPDGTLLASGSDTVRLWDVSSGKLLRELEGEMLSVECVAFSPNGVFLASGGESLDDYTVRLWRVSDGELLHTLTGHKSQINVVAFSPDATLLASGSDTMRLTASQPPFPYWKKIGSFARNRS